MPSVAAGAVGIELTCHRGGSQQNGKKARQGNFEGRDWDRLRHRFYITSRRALLQQRKGRPRWPPSYISRGHRGKGLHGLVGWSNISPTSISLRTL